MQFSKVTIENEQVIKLKGFKINGKIILSDSDRIGNFEKVNVELPKDYLEYLITDRGLLDNLNIETTVW